MILTGKAKEDFEKWLNKEMYYLGRHNFEERDNNIEDLSDNFQNALIIEWFDSVGIYINIEPYIGGGDVVFYFSLINRSADFTDEHYSSVNDDIYFGTRQDASNEAIKKANEIYNSKYFKH